MLHVPQIQTHHFCKHKNCPCRKQLAHKGFQISGDFSLAEKQTCGTQLALKGLAKLNTVQVYQYYSMCFNTNQHVFQKSEQFNQTTALRGLKANNQLGSAVE
jgi:hypothetical protein